MVSCEEFGHYPQCHNILVELASVTLSTAVAAAPMYFKDSCCPLASISIGANAEMSKRGKRHHATFQF